MVHRLQSERQRVLFAEAQAKGYLVTAHSRTRECPPGDMAVYNSFFRWCEAQGIPFGRIARSEGKQGLAYLEVDFIGIPYDRRPSEQVRDEAEQVIRSYAFARDWTRAANGRFSCGIGYWHVDRWPGESADELMGRLLEVAAKGVGKKSDS